VEVPSENMIGIKGGTTQAKCGETLALDDQF
jgi:hypothetical protein